MTIQEILDAAGIEYAESGHHHCRPGWVQLRVCPFCSSPHYHLGWNLALGYANCWKCGGHSKWALLKQLGLPRDLASDLVSATHIPAHVLSRERSQLSAVVPQGIGPLSPPHIDYLRERGFFNVKDLVRVWGLRGIGVAARLGWRIWIPIVHEGRTVSWTTRAIGERVAQRYISASAEEEVVNHKELLYGGDYCQHSAVVVEGPVDAWAVGPGAVALFGTSFTAAQVKRLIRIPRRIVCFDSSSDAQRKAEDLASQLACFPGVTENILIDAKDPGEASPGEIRAIRRAARLA